MYTAVGSVVIMLSKIIQPNKSHALKNSQICCYEINLCKTSLLMGIYAL